MDILRNNDGGFTLTQPDFLDQVEEIFLSKQRMKETETAATEAERHQMRSILGSLSWYASQTAMYLSSSVGLMLSKVNHATVGDLVETNKVVKRARSWKHLQMKIHPMDPNNFSVGCWCDAAHANRHDGSSTKGMFIGICDGHLGDGTMTKVSPVFWQSSKIHRKCRSPAAAETCAAVDGDDEAYAIRFQMSEFLGYPSSIWNINDCIRRIPGLVISDSKNLYDRLSKTIVTLKGEEKRSDLESLCLKESMDCAATELRWVNGEAQLANSWTKMDEQHQVMNFYQLGHRWRITYDQTMTSGRKRKSQGVDAFEKLPSTPAKD